jgi:hypothetical protein
MMSDKLQPGAKLRRRPNGVMPRSPISPFNLSPTAVPPTQHYQSHGAWRQQRCFRAAQGCQQSSHNPSLELDS